MPQQICLQFPFFDNKIEYLMPKNIQSLTTSSLWGRSEPSKVEAPSVERMKEYQRAARMLAPQCFIPDLEIRDQTCAYFLSDAKCFILCFEKKTF